ncbi:helix-turn-helix domain-containing protein [Nocardia cyriacigeorgica]
MNVSELQSPADIARRYDVSERTVRSWIADGRIPAYRVGSKLLKLDPAEVDAALLTKVSAK